MSGDIQAIRDLVAKIEAGLISKSQSGLYEDYCDDRNELLSIVSVKDYVPMYLLNSPNLDIAISYMKGHASGSGSWELRRQFVRDNFSPIRRYLDATESSAVLLTRENLVDISLPNVVSQLNRAKLLISSDPASAVTKAETALAEVCKHIISSQSREIGKSETLISLVSITAKEILKLDKIFDARSFSGISNQAQLIAEIRNSYGDAHPAPSPDDDLAEFAVTSAGNLAIFLLKRYERMPPKQNEEYLF